MSDLPERINVIKTITYHVPSIIADMREAGIEDLSTDGVMEWIEDWVADDFGGLSGLIFQDENGEEL